MWHSRQLIKVSFLPNIWQACLLFFLEDVHIAQTQALFCRKIVLSSPWRLVLIMTQWPKHCPPVFRWILMRNIIHLVLFQVIHSRCWYFSFSFPCFGFIFNNNSCALKQLLFVLLTVAGIWEVWKMLLHITDQRLFSLRTGSLPSCTLIKFSPFSQAPKVFSFPPSSF